MSRWVTKVLFLFLAFLLPTAIFIFLKSFGKNEFEVPALFNDSGPRPADCNSFRYTFPYSVQDSVLSELKWDNQDSITLVIFDDSIPENRHQKSVQVKRILSEFQSENFHIIRVAELSDQGPIKSLNDKVMNLELRHESFLIFKNCIFLLQGIDNAVLVDSKRRIRGQYNLNDLEDADRLIMQEMNILFKRY